MYSADEAMTMANMYSGQVTRRYEESLGGGKRGASKEGVKM